MSSKAFGKLWGWLLASSFSSRIQKWAKIHWLVSLHLTDVRDQVSQVKVDHKHI